MPEVVESAASPAVDHRPETRLRHWSMNIVGVAFVLALCYYGELFLVVILASVLLAFVLAPVVDLLMRLRIPRALSAGIALFLLLGLFAGIGYFSYNQATELWNDLPKYTAKIRDQILQFTKKAESLEVLSQPRERGVLSVRPATDWGGLVTRGFGSVSQGLLAASFIPFLVFFMLSWQHHVRSSTVMLFRMENRHTAYKTLGLIAAMIRTFMVGNVLIGVFVGIASTVVFWALGVPFFYIVGFVSGFLSLVPYLGVFLAMAPPVFMSVGQMNSSNLLTLVVTVAGLHVIALNVLYPKFLGNRLQLNPLAVTMALLFWAWLWGGVGLVLAIPITAAMKIIFDHVESLKPFGAWLGE